MVVKVKIMVCLDMVSCSLECVSILPLPKSYSRRRQTPLKCQYLSQITQYHIPEGHDLNYCIMLIFHV
jgi:hypothetical protein